MVKIQINASTPQTTFHSTGTTNGQQATFGIYDSDSGSQPIQIL